VLTTRQQTRLDHVVNSHGPQSLIASGREVDTGASKIAWISQNYTGAWSGPFLPSHLPVVATRMPLITSVIDDKSPLISYDTTWLPGTAWDDQLATEYVL
jgi:hypothetical protein